MQNLQSNNSSFSTDIIVLFFSNHSESCKALRSYFKNEHLHLFRPICIDQPEIRDIILRSDYIKIHRVPCILQITPDGIVSKYEAEQAFAWTQKFLSQLTQSRLPTSPVESVIQQMPSAREYNSDNLWNIEPQGLQRKNPIQVPINSRMPDLPNQKYLKRFSQDNSILDVTDEEIEMADPVPSRPLPEQNFELPEVRGQIIDPIQDQDQEDDLSQLLDDDPSGMRAVSREENIIKTPPTTTKATSSKSKSSSSSRSGDTMEKSNALKSMAAQIASMREKEDSKIENVKKASMRKQLEASEKQKIRL